MKIRRALISVSDKTGVVDLARFLVDSGAELVATGNTARVLEDAGFHVTPVEALTGMPEAFAGRMKTLSFQICSGILYRRGDSSDEADLKKLDILPIDCVVVNFYPFEKTLAEMREKGVSDRRTLVERIDIGGPTLVRAAAKNAPDVLVLTDPMQYSEVASELSASGEVSDELSLRCAASAWRRVRDYDEAIADEFGGESLSLRYGENPHQSGRMRMGADSPIAWSDPLTPNALSYNNILDLSAAYSLMAEIRHRWPEGFESVVIVKHGNPCGVARVSGVGAAAQARAFELAWNGDPVSAFGGVVVFSSGLDSVVGESLARRFVECVVAPGLKSDSPVLTTLLAKRKNLKAVRVDRWDMMDANSRTTVVGGELIQSADIGLNEVFRGVTQASWPESMNELSAFGVAVTRSLRSNAIALVREESPGAFQLVGAGQGQPNRVDALRILAIPRAQAVVGLNLDGVVLVSDAFFPFRDSVDEAARAGIRWIVQPGGSVRDDEVITACDEHRVAMALTGIRHFRH